MRIEIDSPVISEAQRIDVVYAWRCIIHRTAYAHHLYGVAEFCACVSIEKNWNVLLLVIIGLAIDERIFMISMTTMMMIV